LNFRQQVKIIENPGDTGQYELLINQTLEAGWKLLRVSPELAFFLKIAVTAPGVLVEQKGADRQIRTSEGVSFNENAG